MSESAREFLCGQIVMSLSSLITSGQESVEAHLRVTHRPLDAYVWGKTLGDKVAPNHPTPGWNPYLVNMVGHVDSLGFTDKEVYLGVLLGRRSASTTEGGKFSPVEEVMKPLKKFLNRAEKLAQYVDEQVSVKELEHWRKLAANVHRTLGGSHLKARPATAEELAWVTAHPLWPDMEQPIVTSSSSTTWGAGEIRQIAESDIVHHRKWLEVNQIGVDGDLETGFLATLAVSRFPDTLEFPQQEPWMHFVSTLPYPVDFSTRFTIVPPLKVRKDVSKKLADAKDQAQHIAESGTAIPLAVREQLEVATQLEYIIDKDRMPWAYARHRLTVTGSTEQQLVDRCRTIIEMYRELGIDVSWPTGDQFDLLLESMPGDRVRSSAYYQRQDLGVVAGGMATASSEVGDAVDGVKGWRGPYLGYTTSRVATPVFLSPHVAMTRNYPPGVAIVGAPGGGKSLKLNTRIPVPVSERYPAGWATIGETQRGDSVFAPDGTVTQVVDTSPVFTNHDCYQLTFDDGTSIVADADHEWVVETRAHRIHNICETGQVRRAQCRPEQVEALRAALEKTLPTEWLSAKGGVRTVPDGPSETIWVNATRDLQENGVQPAFGRLLGLQTYGKYFPAHLMINATLRRATRALNDQRGDTGAVTLTTRDMAQNVMVEGGKQLNYSIPVAQALILPESNLPIPPYTLGVWLGDGASWNADITSMDTEIVHRIEADGIVVDLVAADKGEASFYRMRSNMNARLRDLGLVGGDKHIPVAYQRASLEQRRDLFAGLLDTVGGTVGQDGGQEFCVASERLAQDFYELAVGLGIKCFWSTVPARMTFLDGTREDCGTSYRVKFTAKFGPYVSRKMVQLPTMVKSSTKRRYVTNIALVATVPVKCLTVAHPSHQFLISDAMISTHNSFSAFTLAYQMAVEGVWTIYIDPKADAKPMGELQGLGNPRVFDLRDGNDGMLDPFSMGGTKPESKLLALETMRLLLGGQVTEEREEALLNAVERVATEVAPSLSRVVDILLENEGSAGARNLGAVLHTIRDLPFARLCFAATGGSKLNPEDGLTVVTLLGLDLPSAATRSEDYSYENRLAVSVMYLLTRYARRLMLNMNKSHPKAICIDEAWAITSTPQGAKLIPEIARMGRSHNTALVLVSQNAGDLMSESVTNSLSTKIAFRSSIPQEIDDVLTLFGLDLDQNYQYVIRGLRNGECVMQDVDGRVARVQVDAWDEMLKQTFDTNPETRGKTSSAPIGDSSSGDGGGVGG